MKPVLFSTFIILYSFYSQSSIIEVNNLNDSGVGTLRTAIFQAVSSDTIRFNNNLITSGSDTLFLTTEISFSKQLVIKGLYNSNDTLYISGSGITRIFNINSTNNVTIDSMVFINGLANGNGGAINYNSSTDLFIENSIFRNNTASESGGAVHSHANTSINNSTFSNNQSI